MVTRTATGEEPARTMMNAGVKNSRESSLDRLERAIGAVRKVVSRLVKVDININLCTNTLKNTGDWIMATVAYNMNNTFSNVCQIIATPLAHCDMTEKQFEPVF